MDRMNFHWAVNGWISQQGKVMNSDDKKESGWVVRPVDDDEKTIACSIDSGEVNGREANYASGVEECGACQWRLTTRCLAVARELQGLSMCRYVFRASLRG